MWIIMCSLNERNLNLWTMAIESESCLEKDFMCLWEKTLIHVYCCVFVNNFEKNLKIIIIIISWFDNLLKFMRFVVIILMMV